MINLETLTIKKASDHLKNGDFSAKELTAAYLKNIEEKNSALNVYLEVFSDALKSAELIKEFSHPMSGIPVALKDNMLIKGKKASSGSRILENYVATYDSFITKKLKEAGAIILGRTNMDEFAMGSSTENSAYGVTKNPHDFERVPGGSSGGSAAAIAADLALASLGSDTGGSIRQPAAFCGVVGFKPSYGRVSRSGLMALASSLDQIGPFTKTVEDAEIFYNLIKGKDPQDSTSLSDEVKEEENKKKKFKIGIPYHFLAEGVDEAVMSNFQQSIKKLESLGHEIVEIELPNVKYSLAVYYIIMPAEASSNLARYDGVKFGYHQEGSNLLEDYLLSRGNGFGKESRRRIMLGTYVLSSGYYDAYYGKANGVRNLIRNDFEKAFQNIDLILTPTTASPAFKIGEKTTDPVSMYLSDIFTVPANITGMPSISVPSGFTEVSGKRLPLGIQFTAPFLADERLFEIGKQLENYHG